MSCPSLSFPLKKERKKKRIHGLNVKNNAQRKKKIAHFPSTELTSHIDTRRKPTVGLKLKRVPCNCFAIKNAVARRSETFVLIIDNARPLERDRWFWNRLLFFSPPPLSLKKIASTRSPNRAGRTHLREHQTASSRLLYRSLWHMRRNRFVRCV